MFRHPEIKTALTFLNDIPRNNWYKEIFLKTVKDKVVFEIGCGIGILASLALEAGAAYYYGIDIRSSRVKMTQEILKNLGFENKFQVWTTDFLSLSENDVPRDVDILLCERIGDEFQNNLKMRQFLTHSKTLFGNSVKSIPDSWSVSAYIYEGIHDSVFYDYNPSKIINDNRNDLSAGLIEQLNKFDFIKPYGIHNRIFSVTIDNSSEPVEFMVDLRNVNQATIVFDNDIYFNGIPCPSVSALYDWPEPPRLYIKNANAMIKVFWNENKTCYPNYKNGFWDYQKY